MRYLAIANDYDGATVFGIFDTFDSAREHLEGETDKPTAMSGLASWAWIEEWHGPQKIAEFVRDRSDPKRWEKTDVE